MMNLVTKITEHNDNIHVFSSNSTSPSDNGEIEEAVNNFPLARFQTHVVHFDHQQRGEASNSDRIFVQNLCKEMKIPFHCYFWEDELNYRNDIDVNDDDKRFSQEKARNWRMQNMRTLLSDLISDSNLNAGLILTAHHADDSDETLLLKLLRGAHVTNLSGIEPILFTSYNHPLTATARPLLTLRKEEIIDYLTAHDLKWREDESNKSSKYLRNRVRNELLPLINDMVGGKGIFQQRLHNMQEQSKLLKDDLNSRVDEYLKINNITYPSFEESNKIPTIHLFPIPSCDKLDIVQFNAMHHWCNACMKGTHRLEYGQLKRIRRQLEDYPSNRRWFLNVGKGWSVCRNKGTLEMICDKTSGKKCKK